MKNYIITHYFKNGRPGIYTFAGTEDEMMIHVNAIALEMADYTNAYSISFNRENDERSKRYVAQIFADDNIYVEAVEDVYLTTCKVSQKYLEKAKKDVNKDFISNEGRILMKGEF